MGFSNTVLKFCDYYAVWLIKIFIMPFDSGVHHVGMAPKDFHLILYHESLGIVKRREYWRGNMVEEKKCKHQPISQTMNSVIQSIISSGGTLKISTDVFQPQTS